MGPRLYDGQTARGKWTGIFFVMRAEIPAHTPPAIRIRLVTKDIDAFKNMLMTVDYPLMRPYLPQANGHLGIGHPFIRLIAIKQSSPTIVPCTNNAHRSFFTTGR